MASKGTNPKKYWNLRLELVKVALVREWQEALLKCWLMVDIGWWFLCSAIIGFMEEYDFSLIKGIWQRTMNHDYFRVYDPPTKQATSNWVIWWIEQVCSATGCPELGSSNGLEQKYGTTKLSGLVFHHVSYCFKTEKHVGFAYLWQTDAIWPLKLPMQCW